MYHYTPSVRCALIACLSLPAPCLQVFNVAGYYGADQAVCSLYALGRLGGTVIDIGHGKIGTQCGGGC